MVLYWLRLVILTFVTKHKPIWIIEGKYLFVGGEVICIVCKFRWKYKHWYAPVTGWWMSVPMHMASNSTALCVPER